MRRRGWEVSSGNKETDRRHIFSCYPGCLSKTSSFDSAIETAMLGPWELKRNGLRHRCCRTPEPTVETPASRLTCCGSMRHPRLSHWEAVSVGYSWAQPNSRRKHDRAENTSHPRFTAGKNRGNCAPNLSTLDTIFSGSSSSGSS
jgi:hypothetical protein